MNCLLPNIVPETVSGVVLGTGSIGFRHLRVLNHGLGISVAAIPVRPSRKLELQAQHFVVCETLEEAVARGATYAIIATDTGRHLADTCKALLLDCDVLVEKPLAASTSGLGQLAILAREKHRKVFVGCDLRFDRSLLLFRERLPEIGSLHAVRIECQSYLPEWRPNRDYRQAYCARPEEGGVLLDLVHEIDYAMWLFGAPSQVFARLVNTGRLGIHAEETADLYWQTPTGAALSIRLDYLSRRPHRCIRAYGEFGEMEWDGVAQTVTVTKAGEQPQSFAVAHERDQLISDQARAFLGTLKGGEPGTLTTLEQAAIVVSICDAARRSSDSGRMEAVQDWSLA